MSALYDIQMDQYTGGIAEFEMILSCHYRDTRVCE